MADKQAENVPDPRVVYADIIDLPHHRSRKHPPMSLHDRAAQFAPFAALSGYDEMIDEESRRTDRWIEPGESELEELDRKFRLLRDSLAAGKHPEISVLRFVPDQRKAGGRYETLTGTLKRLDMHEKKLILRGNSFPGGEISLDMNRILDCTLE